MRCGTTLMGELLAPRGAPGRHPNVSFANDFTQTFQDLLKLLRKYGTGGFAVSPTVSPEISVAAVTEWLVSLAAKSDGRLQLPDLPLNSTIEDAKRAISAALTAEIRYYSTNPEGEIIGLKQTQVTTEIDLLRQVFGDAREIVMIRDPRDVISSHMMRLRERYTVAYIESMISIILNYYNYLDLRATDPNVLVVRYEDLISGTIQEVRKVLQFIGAAADDYAWESIQAGSVASNSSYGDGGGWTVVENIGIQRSSIGRWRWTLAPRQIELIEGVLGPYMLRWQYGPLVTENRPTITEVQYLFDQASKTNETFRYEIDLRPLALRIAEMNFSLTH
jgi:hypothetical protein